jgi:hypothetical protein
MSGSMIYFSNDWERRNREASERNAHIPASSEEPRRRFRLNLRQLLQFGRKPVDVRRTSGTWQQVNPTANS